MSGQGNNWWTRYIGIPWVPAGKSFAGVNCWGVAQLVYAEEGLDPLPDYPVTAKDMRLIAETIGAEQATGPWGKVAEGEERAFDIAVIWRIAMVDGRYTWGHFHVGIITDPAHVLHCEESMATVRLCFRDCATAERHPSWGRQRITCWRRSANPDPKSLQLLGDGRS